MVKVGDKRRCCKCSSFDVSVRYIEPRSGISGVYEHLVNNCNTCEYSWNSECDDAKKLEGGGQ